jgi:hypothetical protein
MFRGLLRCYAISQTYDGKYQLTVALDGSNHVDVSAVSKLADHALLKMVRYVLLRPLRPKLDGQDLA